MQGGAGRCWAGLWARPHTCFRLTLPLGACRSWEAGGGLRLTVAVTGYRLGVNGGKVCSWPRSVLQRRVSCVGTWGTGAPAGGRDLSRAPTAPTIVTQHFDKFAEQF